MSKRARGNRVITATWVACTVWVVADVAVAAPPELVIDPIAGLTTGQHIAPLETAIPLGTVLQIRQPWQVGPAPDDPSPKRVDDDWNSEGVIVWSGVDVSFASLDGSVARSTMSQLGQQVISARFVDPDGNTLWENTLTLNVVDVPTSLIAAETQDATVIEAATAGHMTNEDTMKLFFSLESVAGLHWISADRPGDWTKRPTQTTSGHYLTSTRRTVSFAVEADPVEFSSLMEWRVDGNAVALGSTFDHRFDTVGMHTVSVGPPGRSLSMRVEIYHVTLTSHTPGVDIIPQGEPVIFEAVTNPPGYEDYITWLASTKYGTGSPILGFGSTFTVLFEDTFGDDPVNGLWQWLGVKADSTTIGQDQKPTYACCLGADDVCYQDMNSIDCQGVLGGTSGGEGSTCEPDLCAAEAVTYCRYNVSGIALADGCTLDTCPIKVNMNASHWLKTCDTTDDCTDPQNIGPFPCAGGGTCTTTEDVKDCR